MELCQSYLTLMTESSERLCATTGSVKRIDKFATVLVSQHVLMKPRRNVENRQQTKFRLRCQTTINGYHIWYVICQDTSKPKTTTDIKLGTGLLNCTKYHMEQITAELLLMLQSMYVMCVIVYDQNPKKVDTSFTPFNIVFPFWIQLVGS